MTLRRMSALSLTVSSDVALRSATRNASLSTKTEWGVLREWVSGREEEYFQSQEQQRTSALLVALRPHLTLTIFGQAYHILSAIGKWGGPTPTPEELKLSTNSAPIERYRRFIFYTNGHRSPV